MKYLVKVEYHRTYFQNIEIEAENAGDACELAINEADDNGAWDAYDEMGPSYVSEIEAAGPFVIGSLDIPHKFTEGVTLGFVSAEEAD
jgi:hypothetical protein